MYIHPPVHNLKKCYPIFFEFFYLINNKEENTPVNIELTHIN